jgi:hypothetical protein
MNPHDEQNLERLVHQTLRTLPPRRAPRSLEDRVLAEIERRAALPWWRQGIAHWPMAARVGGLIGLAVVARLFFVLSNWVMAGFDSTPLRAELAVQMTWLRVIGRLGQTALDAAGTVANSIPAPWLLGGGLFVAALYVALVGLGILAYRTLYTSR